MTLLAVVALVAQAFISGIVAGALIERRHRRRLEMARVMFRPRRHYANHGGE